MLEFLQFFKKNKRKYVKFFDDIEPQEVFLDSLAKKEEERIGIQEKKFEVSLPKKIIKIFFALIIIFIFGFFARSFQIQIRDYKKYSALAKKNKFVSKFIEASRGVIYDSNGKQLVFNERNFNLVFDKKYFPHSKEKENMILKKISKIINVNVNDIRKKIKSGKERIVPVSENINHKTLILLKTEIQNFPGFEITQNSGRRYIDAKVFSHIIGYMGRITPSELKRNPEFYNSNDYVGKDGLEESYEKFLRKDPGKVRIEKDVQGNLLSKKIISLPSSGKSLVLWINAELQKKSEQALEKTLKKTNTKKGVVIAINPNNGGVMAMVSIPSFDNNLFNKGADQKTLIKLLTDPKKQDPFLNRAISGLYPNGSTIKPLIASAALQEKIIPPNKKLFCKKEIKIPNKYYPGRFTIKRDWAFHGWTDMRKAIAESCDVYFYTIGGGYKNQAGLGPSKIKKYLDLFGLGEKTGIDLPGESKGLVPSPQWKEKVKKVPWWDGDTYNLSIGQGDILVTPIQVAAAFVAIVNGGTIYQPKIVKEIIDTNKKVIKKIKPKIIRSGFINPEYLKIVREGMRQAVTGKNSPLASSTMLDSLPIEAAAKTGTAETPFPDHYHNWVVVFAPYKKPQIVLVVMIENIKGLKSAALPTAKEILEWYFNKLKIKNQNAK